MKITINISEISDFKKDFLDAFQDVIKPPNEIITKRIIRGDVEMSSKIKPPYTRCLEAST